MPGRTRVRIVLTLLVLLLAVVAVLGAALGQNPVPVPEVVGSLLHHLHLPWGPLPDATDEQALWQVRFPRVALGLLVGAALATAGAIMQGVFANPLADPGVVGVSSGAAMGAAIVIALGGLGTAGYLVAGGAFVCGLAVTAAVYAMSRMHGRTDLVTLILTGIAVNALAGAVIAYAIFRAPPQARDQIVFWQLGSLNRATWSQVWLVGAMIAVALVAAYGLARQLDLLALGEYAARHLGVDVESVRRWCIVVVAVLVAAGVMFSGIILFVGLVTPHLLRLLVGPGHRVLIPASALAGASLLVLADIVARTAVPYADLPIGMLTSAVGAPVFLLVLRRARRRRGDLG